MPARGHYSEEEKKELIAKVEALAQSTYGGSVNKACNELGINPTTFRAWTTPGGWSALSRPRSTRRKYTGKVKSFDLTTPEEQPTEVVEQEPTPSTNEDVTVLLVRCRSEAVGAIIGTALNKIYNLTNIKG